MATWIVYQNHSTYPNKYPKKHPTDPNNYLALTTLFRMIRHTLSQFELGKKTRAQLRQEKMTNMERRQRVDTPGTSNLKV